MYWLCIILNKIRTKQTSPYTFFKIIGFMHWNCHFSLHKYRNQSMYVYVFGNWYNSFSFSNCVFHFFIVFFSYRIRKSDYSHVFERNTLSVCCFFFKVILNKHYVLQHLSQARYTYTFSQLMWWVFFQSVVHVLIYTPPPFKLKWYRLCIYSSI